MTNFILFKHKSNGNIASYPEHYKDHPVFGADLEVYVEGEYEEDKVVAETHELPVEQRAQRKAVAPAPAKKNEEN